MRCICTLLGKLAGAWIWPQTTIQCGENEWGYYSKPLHECAEHLNGQRFGAFIRCRFKRIRCVRRIKVKVPKIKKILLYEIKFPVPIYSYLQNPWLGGYRPQILILSVLNWICWTPPPEQNSWVCYWVLVILCNDFQSTTNSTKQVQLTITKWVTEFPL